MLAIVLTKVDETLLGALALQKCKDFTVYLPEEDPVEADYESKLQLRHGDWRQTQEPLTCILEPGAMPGPSFVKSILHTTSRHPEFDVYHVNLEGEKPFPRKTDTRKLFKLVLLGNAPAPLSSFVFRSATLREKSVYEADGDLEVLPTVINCAQEHPLRRVWLETLPWRAPEEPKDPAAQEAAIRARLDLYRWTESFFGDNDYPLSVGDQMDLFAREVAKLYPSYTAEELKEIMYSFQVSQGSLRKLRAGNAIKAALKERQKGLK